MPRTLYRPLRSQIAPSLTRRPTLFSLCLCRYSTPMPLRRRRVKAATLGTLSGAGPEWTCAIKVSEAPGGPADPPRLSVGG